jgi:hypothetical protein
MTEQELSAPLVALARRLRSDPRYMAYVLTAYQTQENLTDDEMARELGTLPLLALKLSLCKRPDATSPNFAEQVREIAEFTLTDEVKLAHVLRQVDGLEKLAGRAASPSSAELKTQPELPLAGLLAAARDRDEELHAEEQSGDEEDSEE